MLWLQTESRPRAHPAPQEPRQLAAGTGTPLAQRLDRMQAKFAFPLFFPSLRPDARKGLELWQN